MTTPVSFELAKSLKDKRFDLSTERFYPKPKCKLFGIDEYGKPYPIVNKTQTYFIGKAAVLKEENSYLAPTIAEVVMWLYDKYNIWVSVLCDAGRDELFTFKIYSTEIGKEKCLVNGYMHDSPTEAYESAIEYALNYMI